MSGIFPLPKDALNVGSGPLNLVKCHGGVEVCGLLQLEHSYDPIEMYGANYGYRSGLNSKMINHLNSKVEAILADTELQAGDIVIDIGSNDGTSLAAFPHNLTLIGVDPTIAKFSHYYQPHIIQIPDFFSFDNIKNVIGEKRAKVVSSHSMFYDLEDPVGFAIQVRLVLDVDGIWVFEQSYMPTMVEKTAYDTVCHEHVEYYGLHQIVWIIEQAGMRVTEVEFNDTNGGSFSVTATPRENINRRTSSRVFEVLEEEKKLGFLTLDPYHEFKEKTFHRRDELLVFIEDAKLEGKRICGVGASTKGNTLLQFTGVTNLQIESIAEINPDKFGCETPGTRIPIISQSEVLSTFPEYLLVLPWHFRSFFTESKLFAGQNLLFPLPHVEVISKT